MPRGPPAKRGRGCGANAGCAEQGVPTGEKHHAVTWTRRPPRPLGGGLEHKHPSDTPGWAPASGLA